MKIMIRIIAIPIIVLLQLIHWAFDGVSKVYCLAAGVHYNILAICALLAIITGQWKALGILGILVAASLVLLFGAGWIMAMLDRIKIRLTEAL